MNIKNIRQSVFETNSSSTHCVVINKEDASLIEESYKQCIDSYTSKITFNFSGEYGWCTEEFTDISNKLAYMFICIIRNKLEHIWYDDKKDPKIIQEKLELRKIQIESIKEIFNDINNLVKETTGYEIYCEDFENLCDKIENNEVDSSDVIDGYVDHSDDKYNGIIEPLLNNREDLKRFLFDTKSILYTSNDNGSNDHFEDLNYQYYGGN